MRGTVLLIAFVLATACGCKTVPTSGECPDSMGQRCLTDRQCAVDSKRGCIYCTCAAPMYQQMPLSDDGRLRMMEDGH